MIFDISTQITEMAARDEMERMRRIASASAAYYNVYEKPLVVRRGAHDDNLLPNLARTIVDKGASFLVGKSPVLDIQGESNRGSESDAGIWLAKCLKFNRMDSLLTNAATNGGISGHVFLKLNGKREGEKYPRIILLDSNSVTATTDPEDISLVMRYKIQFNALDPKTAKPIVRKQIVERDESGKWFISDFVSGGNAGGGELKVYNFQKIGETTEWPYLWPPILDCQNLPAPNAYYGMSDLEPDILHLIGRIHYVLSNTGRINRIHAHPKTVGKGFKADQLQAAPDETILLPVGADMTLLEAHGDIAGSISLYDKLYDLLFMLARIPPVSVGKLETIGAVAGVALQILYAPLMELTNTKRLLYGPLLESLAERLLEMGGYTDKQVSVVWPDPMPKNEVEQRNIWSSDVAMGIASKETISAKAGYDWAEEQKRIQVDSVDASAALLKAMENKPPQPGNKTGL